jgi:hypothetical protein
MLVALLVVTTAVSAQTKVAKVEELFTLMRMEQTFSQLMDVIMEQTKSSVMSQLTGTRVPPEMQADVDQLQADVYQLLLKYMGWNQLKGEFTAMYAEAFTDEELDAILAFYRGPGGQAFVVKQPQLMQRSSEVSQRKMMEASPALQAVLAEWTQKMKAKTPPR